MDVQLRQTIGRIPGVRPAARWTRRAVTRVRERLAVPRPAAPPVKVNHGIGGDTPPFATLPDVDRDTFAAQVAARKWFHTFDFGDGIVGRGPDPSHQKTKYLGMPDSFEGLTVLDVGAYDGYYSFEAARRGAADVLATDHWVWTWPGETARDNFEFVRDRTGLAVRDQYIRVEDLTPEAVGGQFDVVFFYGVLYHAPDPLGYLKRVRSVTRQYVLIETVVDVLDVARPALAYYPGGYLNRDASNFFGPNMPALEGLLSDAGFSRMDDLGVWREHEIELTRGVEPPSGPPTSGRAVVRAWV